jgi:hypothetical protein
VVRKFHEGERVLVRHYTQGQNWVAGSVVSVDGERSYTVELKNGQIAKRHVDQMRKCAFVESSEMAVSTRGN